MKEGGVVRRGGEIIKDSLRKEKMKAAESGGGRVGV